MVNSVIIDLVPVINITNPVVKVTHQSSKKYNSVSRPFTKVLSITVN